MTTKFTFYSPFSESSSTAKGTPNSRIRYRNLFGALFITVLFGLLAAVPGAQATGGNNLRAIGLTQDGVLVRFNTGSPGKTQDSGFIAPLQAPDTAIVGIDFRVQDGLLYGVGNGGGGLGGGIYTIDTRTAQATFVDRLDIPFDLNANNFGVDFNPAANALRVVSDTGQNLRHPFAGALQGQTQLDGFLRYPPVPPAAATPALGVTAAAYTNNDDAIAVPNAATTGTTLFDIDTVLDANNPVDQTDVVVVQSPANSGNIVQTGSLGVDAGTQGGFDIFSQLRKGVAVDNRGFASLFVNGKYHLHRINLLTGKATTVDAFDDQVVDIAIRLNQ